MAREESSREDLLREATALVERIELLPRAPVSATPTQLSAKTSVVAGFRLDGGLSIFFGEDPVYQFNAAGKLRRAYCNGLLFKAERGRLVSLTRERSEQQVQLVRHELTDADQAKFLENMAIRLHQFAELLTANEFDVRGQMPPAADVRGHLRSWLESHEFWSIAERPNA